MTEKFLRLPAVMELTGLGRSTIYEKIKEGTFPRPVHPTGQKASAWLESEIVELQQRRIAEREANAEAA